ncbi:phosphatidylserine decarboxylase [Chlorobium sp. N1]|uniref:phosphatidylserine decarboxylase n=1 Tax=Chlorobium sp. N1 TaxID=2491138 RepID=UPI0010391E7B|nr:phosphatidylserine decarboxylase [Chlorobium sp. N1]TCD48963.1 phosphatidylserine decarboxylase [Chlorobium sp. N1]
MFTPYGRSTLLKTVIIALLLGLSGLLFPPAAGAALAVLALLLSGFALWFFRDPERSPAESGRVILAPADGKVILVEERDHPFTGKGSTLVSIFMSPLNVHVNRIPVKGRVRLLEYHPGSFNMAFDHRSMEENERMDIGIESEAGKVFFSQVSGFLARRIVCPLELGEAVECGRRFGMIKFGSRVDILIPPGSKPALTVGEKTRAGETLIARY